MRLPLVPDLHPRLPTSGEHGEDGSRAPKFPGEVEALKYAVGQAAANLHLSDRRGQDGSYDTEQEDGFQKASQL